MEEAIFIPEEAFEHLPEDLRAQFLAIKSEMADVVGPAAGILDKLNRIVLALPDMVTLRHIHNRLSVAPFGGKLDEMLDHEMMTMAFVMAYVRVMNGGAGNSSFNRNLLPQHLRPVHDEIEALRNGRYAHSGGHHSVSGAMEITLEDGIFKVGSKASMGYYVRGRNEWRELVDFLDAATFDRIKKQIDKLKEQTGREWEFASGPAPDWARQDGHDDAP